MTIKFRQGTEVRHVSGAIGHVVVSAPDTNDSIVVVTEDGEYDTWFTHDIVLRHSLRDIYVLIAEPGFSTRQWSSVERCRDEAEVMLKEATARPVAILSIENDGEDITLERL